MSDPFIFGQMQIVPSKDGKYKKPTRSSVVYWVYGATGDATGKPDLTVENSFDQKRPKARSSSIRPSLRR